MSSHVTGINVLQAEILTKMEISLTGGHNSPRTILKSNPNAWCTSTETSPGT